jgi:enoyl-CoA hydratase
MMSGDDMTPDLPPHADQPVQVTSDGPVRVVTLNRPDQLNAFNAQMHHDLTAVWRKLAADDQARAVVLTGAGRVFSAGGDFAWMRQTHEDSAQATASTDEAGELIQQMLRFPLPVVAAVNGPAVGLGCSLTILADLVVMADSAHLADPHVSVGLVAGDGGAFWPLVTGLHRAKEFLFLGTRLSAQDALAYGLANQVVPAAQVHDEALELAHRLAAQPAGALRDTKAALNAYANAAAWPVAQFAMVAERASMASCEHGELLARLTSPSAEKPPPPTTTAKPDQ